MNILFVHQNFPAQFLHLAEALKKRGHRCMALTSATNERKFNLPHARYRFDPPEVQGIARTHVTHLARAEAVAKAADSLRRRHHVMPDVVFSHTGWGEGLLLREVWPDAKHLAYAEFCYRPRGLDVGFDPEFGRSSLDTRLRTVAMQAYLMQGVLEADSALSPTQWQAESFPEKLSRDITVCHDGIDTDRACPNPDARFRLANGRVLGTDDEVLTFVNRNLEPYRGFHIFMRALPEVLRARPKAQVVIVGGERRGYGALPADGRSWKDVMLAELERKLDLSRVHFVGHIPYERYLALLQVSRVHAYLSYPFVLSWSMMEAMASGCNVIASDTGPCREMIRDGETGTLVDFFDIEGWSAAIIEGLSNPEAAISRRAAARSHIRENYDLKTVCLPRLIAFTEGAGA